MRSTTRRAYFLAGVLWLGACSDGAIETTRNFTAASRGEIASSLVQLDRLRGRTWRLSEEGVTLREVGRGREVAIDLPDWLIARAEFACLPAIVLGPMGELVVTSNVIPTLWRIDPVTLAVSVHPLELEGSDGIEVGFSGLRFSAAHGAYFGVSQARGSVWKINASLTRAEKVVGAGQATEQSERSLTCAIS